MPCSVHREREALPKAFIELLNDARLSNNAMKVFGAASNALNAAEINETFGYAVDWDTEIHLRKPLYASGKTNRKYSFWDGLLGLQPKKRRIRSLLRKIRNITRSSAKRR